MDNLNLNIPTLEYVGSVVAINTLYTRPSLETWVYKAKPKTSELI